MTAICIFCGSRDGARPEYKQAAMELVEELVKRKITLIYGGANSGLMGTIANHALKLGGKVIGVIPHSFEREKAHTGLTELHYVDDMHDRKKMLADLADGFIALPGGTGTMDELFQEIALRQTGYHNKTCGLLNTANYYDSLVAFLNQAANEGFLDNQWQQHLVISRSPSELLSQLLDPLP